MLWAAGGWVCGEGGLRVDVGLDVEMVDMKIYIKGDEWVWRGLGVEVVVWKV